MKTENAWKIFNVYDRHNNTYGSYDVENGSYVSFNQWSSSGGVIYNKEGRTYRDVRYGPLAVFDTLSNALEFLKDLGYSDDRIKLNLSIRKVKYRPSKVNELFTLGHPYCSGLYKYLNDNDTPKGTEYADWVEILP